MLKIIEDGFALVSTSVLGLVVATWEKVSNSKMYSWK